MSFSLSEYTNIDVGWSFAPDPIVELTALTQIAAFKGPLRSRRGMEGRTRRRRDGKGREKGMGRREKGEVGGIASLGRWGIDAPENRHRFYMSDEPEVGARNLASVYGASFGRVSWVLEWVCTGW